MPNKPLSIKTRAHGLYRAMVLRFGPKYWKSGKRQGQMRVPGQNLPYSEPELLEWLTGQFSSGVRSCPYCGAPIDALSASLDHKQPLTRGGYLFLSNLEAICAACNRLKGGLTPAEFRELMEWVYRQAPAAQQDVIGRLKLGAMGARLRFHGGKK